MKYNVYRIDEVCSIVKGIYPTLKTEPGEFPMVVTAEYRRSASSYQLEGPAVCVPLISSTGHGHASIHRVHYQEGKFALANLLVALLPKDPHRCIARYLYHLLMAKKDEYFVPLMAGTANVSLKEEDIAGVEIPLPSIEDQQRIVARIDEVADKIEEARGLRRETAEDLEKVTGILVERILATMRTSADEVTVESIAHSVTDGDHQPPPKAESGVPFIFISNIAKGKLSFEDCKWVSSAYFSALAPARVPQRGDVLYTAVGSYGIPYLVDTDEPFCFQRHIAIIKPDRRRILPEYLTWALSSASVFDQATKAATGSAQLTVPLRGIRQLRFLLPSLSEQGHIVAYLDNLRMKLEALKSFQAETAAELNALLPSILDKAFRGKL